MLPGITDSSFSLFVTILIVVVVIITPDTFGGGYLL